MHRKIIAALAGLALLIGILAAPTTGAAAQVPRKCVMVGQVVSGELPGVWTVWAQTWRCVPPGPASEIRYVLVVH
nr:hypothetical protein [Micromonospora sp. DSM 115978]